MFGWAPALLWIIFGSILIGGVHDFTALLASTRHRGRGITEIVREYMSNRSYILFLIFVWLALVYIIVAFTDITAQSFVGSQTLENGEVVTGAGIASASLMYIALPVLMGLSLRYTRIGLWPATAIFLPMVLLAIYLGQLFPIDLASILGVSETAAHKFWDVGILLYCLVAAVCPVWLLLQPRGHLGGFFLYFFILAGISGMVFGDREVLYPAFIGFHSAKGDGLIPVLFITIACGAVSGFHSLIASGTTSKQLKYETDVKSVGYGTMLLEAGVAFIALSCVMALPLGAPILASSPNLVFANGIASSLELVGVPPGLAISIMLMAFTTFVYDTLDICTRLGRYIIQELSGRPDWKGRWLGTSLTALVPLVFVTQTLTDPQGKVIPGVAGLLAVIRRKQSAACGTDFARGQCLGLENPAESEPVPRHTVAMRIYVSYELLGTLRYGHERVQKPGWFVCSNCHRKCFAGISRSNACRRNGNFRSQLVVRFRLR
jgi:carbon starvation protein